MKMKYRILLAWILAGTIKAIAAAPGEMQPNIVVIFADDLGYSDLGCYGAKYPTPSLDQMAAEGFRSTDMNVPANVCSPSRSALLTGRYPMRNGHPYFQTNYHSKQQSKGTYGLHPDELTIAELLKPAGYRTFAVGKWHLGFDKEGSHPTDAGFDSYFGLPYNYSKGRGKRNMSIYRDRKLETAKVPFPAITRQYNEEVVKFIGEQTKDQPFFIYMAHQIAHSPILPSPPFKGKSKKGKYADFVTELDDSVGQVLQALRDNDLDEKTLVVFLADNGPTGPGSAKPLKGGKYTTMEGGHRVPAIFRWPGKIPAGQVSGTTISSMNLLPLFCQMAGAKVPIDRTMDGKDIFDVLLGQSDESPHEFLYYYNGLNLQAVRKGKWKLHVPRSIEDQPYWGKNNRGGFAKLEENFLVNMETDIGEQSNVAADHPKVVAMLLKEANRVREELGEVGQSGSDQRPPWPPAPPSEN